MIRRHFAVSLRDRMHQDDDLSLVLPQDSEKIIKDFGNAMITATQHMSSRVHSYPSLSIEEIKRQKDHRGRITTLREAYVNIAAWSRISSTLDRTHISGNEFWELVNNVEIFEDNIFCLGTIITGPNPDEYIVPAKVQEIYDKSIDALEDFAKDFASPLYWQIHNQRSSKAEDLLFGRFLEKA